MEVVTSQLAKNQTQPLGSTTAQRSITANHVQDA